MASSAEFLNYVIDQVHDAGNIRCKKMFGEYMVYVNEKPIVLVCDNTAFIKHLPEIQEYHLDTGYPYEGSKLHYILDIDDKAKSVEIVSLVENLTPLPKPRSRKCK